MQELKVHGSIFFLLKKYINNNYPENTWEELNKRAGFEDISFLVTESYPIDFLNALVAKATEMTNVSRHELMEAFGHYLVNDLFVLYSHYINLEWRTFEMILNTEEVMHGAVRRLNSTAEPPILNVSKVNDKLLIVDYYSRRKMAPLAVGIVKGIADYYGEGEYIKVTCLSDYDDDRIQIRIEHINN